jgi:hypothetical protein
LWPPWTPLELSMHHYKSTHFSFMPCPVLHKKSVSSHNGFRYFNFPLLDQILIIHPTQELPQDVHIFFKGVVQKIRSIIVHNF